MREGDGDVVGRRGSVEVERGRGEGSGGREDLYSRHGRRGRGGLVRATLGPADRECATGDQIQ